MEPRNIMLGRFGLVLGPLVASLIVFNEPPAGLSPEAWLVAACAAWSIIWWVTEALPLPVTALLPLILLPVTGVAPFKQVSASYAHPIVYLFVGGFILALAIERWNLHKRIALFVIHAVGSGGGRLTAGFMLTAALLSMWISNTATTVLLLPVAFSVIALIAKEHPELDDAARHRFTVALLLSVAYAATVGGMTTLIGTAPNAVLAGFLSDNYGYEVGFARWTLFTLPLAVLILPLTWFMLTRIVFPVHVDETPGVLDTLRRYRQELGAMSVQEKMVACVFAAMALAWLTRPLLQKLPGLSGLSDAVIALVAAMTVFALPGEKGGRLLEWTATTRLPWGLLLLFGAGLSLAAAMLDTGLSSWMGGSLQGVLGEVHPLVAIAIVVGVILLLTEFTSNTATTVSFLPVVAVLAVDAGNAAYWLAVPATLAASCAFMLPIATPPNAVVFSSGSVPMADMMRAGAGLNIITAVVVTLYAYYVVPLAF